MELFLESRDEKQVVIRPYGQQDDHRQWDHEPVQVHSQEVLPNQDRDTHRCAERYRDGADNDQGRHHAAGDQKHDDEDQAERGDTRQDEVILGALLQIPVGCGRAAHVNLRVLQRCSLDCVCDCLPDVADSLDSLYRGRVALM
ncbi:Uncharacterised protein [Mycobacteroides abscessus subsp. massiliense]|nr:Uncharacterised protein [Mycobacteroides abscessus subsp. massiliense]